MACVVIVSMFSPFYTSITNIHTSIQNNNSFYTVIYAAGHRGSSEASPSLGRAAMSRRGQETHTHELHRAGGAHISRGVLTYLLAHKTDSIDSQNHKG